MVNKPRGKSSFWVVRQFKNRYPGLKVGYAGTLDPLAEGLLIVLVGKSTKKQKDFENLDKEYEVELVFGITSSGYDLDGEVTIGNNLDKLKKVSEEKTKKIITKKYLGNIVQTVPLYSAVKHKGQRLYKLARKGRINDIVLPKREVELTEFSIVGFFEGKLLKRDNLKMALNTFPKLNIRLKVSKGFYVRSFVNDLGGEFGVGAVTTKLVRTKIGSYLLKDAIAIKEDIRASEDR